LTEYQTSGQWEGPTAETWLMSHKGHRGVDLFGLITHHRGPTDFHSHPQRMREPPPLAICHPNKKSPSLPDTRWDRVTAHILSTSKPESQISLMHTAPVGSKQTQHATIHILPGGEVERPFSYVLWHFLNINTPNPCI
jgi:hypothetical protein